MQLQNVCDLIFGLLCFRGLVAVGDLGDAVHRASVRGLQSHVLGAGPFQQRHRRSEAQRLRCRLHRPIRCMSLTSYQVHVVRVLSTVALKCK